MELLATATGHDRAWVEALLLGRLKASIRDARAPEALHQLQVEGAHQAMAESVAELPETHPLYQAVHRTQASS